MTAAVSKSQFDGPIDTRTPPSFIGLTDLTPRSWLAAAETDMRMMNDNHIRAAEVKVKIRWTVTRV